MSILKEPKHSCGIANRTTSRNRLVDLESILIIMTTLWLNWWWICWIFVFSVAWMWGVASRLPRGRNGSIVFHVANLAEDFSSTWHWKAGRREMAGRSFLPLGRITYVSNEVNPIEDTLWWWQCFIATLILIQSLSNDSSSLLSFRGELRTKRRSISIPSSHFQPYPRR